MKIAIGCDHRGVSPKSKLAHTLAQQGHEVVDVGANSDQAVDYPDIAAAVASRVAAGEADRGVLICGTGIGMSIAANKFAQVRAAVCHDEFTAEICRRHNDVNVLCLSADVPPDRTARIVEVWLHTAFEGGRHARRVEKITALEQHAGGGSA